jgi:hypothetical protein
MTLVTKHNLNLMKTHMHFVLAALFAAFVITPQAALSRANRLPETRDSVSLNVLQAIDYAEFTRIVTLTMCKRKPELLQRLPACSKITNVPNAVIEKMALPHFNRHVSYVDAKSALTFWSSPGGNSISKKLLRELAEGNATLLTDDERRLLNNFNQSEAGAALSRLASDREVSQAMIRAIGAYVL